MPDSPDRQVPPPPPEGGATPIPDVSSRSGQVPRRGSDQRTSASRPTPPKRGRAGEAVPTPPTPPAPPAPPVAPSAPSLGLGAASGEGASGRRTPGRRQPLRQADGQRDQGNRPSARERLQRLAKQQELTKQQEQRAKDPQAKDSSRRASRSGAGAVPAAPRPVESTASARTQPKGPSPKAQPSRGDRAIPARGQQVVPVVPEPPTRKPAPSAAGRIPEPPMRATGPAPARRRPTNRILEALDAKLAADQAAQAKEKAARRERDDAVRRVRPTLSARRLAPPKAPTPSVTSSVPIAPRVPQAGRSGHPVEPEVIGLPDSPALGDVVVPLPDPSVPPVPVIPLKPATPEAEPAMPFTDEAPVAQVSEPSEDPLAASYERLVKAAKRQAALEAALSPDAAHDETDHGVTAPADPAVPADEPVVSEPVGTVPVVPGEPLADPVVDAVVADDAVGAAPVVHAEPNLDDLHDEFEQAKRDADRFFGPDDFTPVEAAIPAEAPATSEEPVEGEPVGDAPLAEAVDEAAVDAGAVDAPMQADAGATPAEDVIIPEEVTPPTGMPVVAEGAEIEDAEIVADPQAPAGDDIIGTIIATDLDLITDPATVEAVDPDTVTVNDAIVDAMPVDEATIDEALASAPARVVDDEEPITPPVVEPPIEETPPQSRGFRALTGVLILIIFALVCSAAYRMMMRPGGGMVEPTPTPIVPTEQTERPGESASPSRSPKATEVTPVPALPPREPLPSDAAIPPALPGQSTTPEVMGGAGNVEIGQHTISLSRINDVNLPGLIDKPVAGENVQVQSILGDGAYVWMGSDQDNRILAVIPEPFRERLKDLQAGDRVDFVGTLASADVPEILAPEQGRDRLIRQGAAIEVRDITVRQ